MLTSIVSSPKLDKYVFKRFIVYIFKPKKINLKVETFLQKGNIDLYCF